MIGHLGAADGCRPGCRLLIMNATAWAPGTLCWLCGSSLTSVSSLHAFVQSFYSKEPRRCPFIMMCCTLVEETRWNRTNVKIVTLIDTIACL